MDDKQLTKAILDQCKKLEPIDIFLAIKRNKEFVSYLSDKNKDNTLNIHVKIVETMENYLDENIS